MSTVAFARTISGATMIIDSGTPFPLMGTASASSDDLYVNVTTTDGFSRPIPATNTITINGITTAETSAAAIVNSLNATVFTTGSPFKIYRALLTQTSTSAPTAVVLQNTLGGTLVWTRTGAGAYTGTLAGAFLANKVFARCTPIGVDSATAVYAGIGRGTDNTVVLGTGVVGAAVSDAKLSGTPVEILVLI